APARVLPEDGPEVAWFRRIGDEVRARGMEPDPETLRPFLKISGAPVPDDGPLPGEGVRGVNRAHGGRPPSEAHPPLEVVREAGIPSLVASGGHQPALERMCDTVAAEPGRRRSGAPRAGHFAAAAPG